MKHLRACLLHLGAAGVLSPSATSQVNLLHCWTDGFDRVVSDFDVDRDGVPDVAVTVFDGAAQTRRVRVYSGRSFATLWRADRFGVQSDYEESLALTDIDGDTYVDLIHGRKWDSGNGGADDRGVVEVTRSTAGGLFAAPYWRHAGRQLNDLFGDRVVSLRAGAAKRIAVGASGKCSNLAYVRVLDSSGNLVQDLDDRQCTYFGDALANAGDLNGDGFDEIVVGANEHSVPGNGRAVLYDGATFAVRFAWQGDALRDHLGCSVAGLGDVDGDGVGDIAVGANQHENGAQGYVRVLSGASGRPLWTASGRAPGHLFGGDIAAVGDVSGDGIPDIAICAPLGGYVDVRDGRTGALLWSMSGPTGFGSRVAYGGRFAGKTRLVIGEAAGVCLYEIDPPLHRVYGNGCPGRLGVPVLAGDSGRPPRGGQDYEITVSNIPAPEAAILLVGASNSSWGVPPIALPLQLDGIGMPGCQLWSAIDVTVPMFRVRAGASGCRVAIPMLPGFGFFMQALVFDSAANSAGMILSNAVQVRV